MVLEITLNSNEIIVFLILSYFLLQKNGFHIAGKMNHIAIMKYMLLLDKILTHILKIWVWQATESSHSLQIYIFLKLQWAATVVDRSPKWNSSDVVRLLHIFLGYPELSGAFWQISPGQLVSQLLSLLPKLLLNIILLG